MASNNFRFSFRYYSDLLFNHVLRRHTQLKRPVRISCFERNPAKLLVSFNFHSFLQYDLLRSTPRTTTIFIFTNNPRNGRRWFTISSNAWVTEYDRWPTSWRSTNTSIWSSQGHDASRSLSSCKPTICATAIYESSSSSNRTDIRKFSGGTVYCRYTSCRSPSWSTW